MTVDLEPILRQLADHQRIAALATTLREQTATRLHVAPALTAARTAIVAALATLTQHPLLYIVGSGEAALRAREDLCQWLDPEAVLLFQAGDALPYEPMSPGNDVIAGRLRVLAALQQEPRIKNQEPGVDNDDAGSRFSVLGSPLVIVAPVKALLQPTLSPAERDQASMQLKRGDEHNLDELVARWVAIGYRAAPTVEEPGELNRRGGIVDIFPPGDDLPLRIEFFGDEIDSLRRFDPITQRSEAQVREATVGPAHEIPLWRRERAIERLHALDTTSMRPEALAEWESAIARIAQGERFEGRALFAPFFWETPMPEQNQEPGARFGRTKNHDADSWAVLGSKAPSSLIEHLPPGSPVIFSELMLLAQQASEQHHHADERRKVHIESGELPADFPRPYLLWDELLAQGATATLVNLSNNDLDLGVGGW